MSNSSGLPVFERAVDARGRLLRVEADHTGVTPGVLVLTFDVGRIAIRPEEAGLSVEHVEDPAALPSGQESLEDVEPWWRLLGQPITAAWPGGVEEGVGARGLGDLMILKMRFREKAENPRVVRIEATGTALRISLDEIQS
jgi:hypothetical protein